MPVERKKIVSTEDLRHAEYYDMQGVYDDLYARSKAGEHFTDLWTCGSEVQDRCSGKGIC